ncbi:MAG: 4-alpha-glucanotransferase, partial [Oceanidesulfovibrio sp.]
DVRELRRLFGLPGMKIVQFAFGKEWPKHVPHLHTTDSVVYTGTHDNNTFRGWYRTEATEAERETFHEYLGHAPLEGQVHQEGIRMAMASVANTVVVPMQDVLGLDESCRMNKPSTLSGNWEWRLLPEEATTESFAETARMARFFGRAGE